MMTTNNELLILRKQIGREIAHLRMEANLSVRDLSALCGVHYTSLNKIEKGNYNASIDIINTILITLNSQLTMSKRNYTIELEEDRIDYLRSLGGNYICDDDECYKPIYELSYYYSDECEMESIAEYNSLDEALSNITRRGKGESSDNYSPSIILGVKLEICERGEDGKIIETGEYLRTCYLSRTPLEDWFLGECRFSPASEEVAERNRKLADELNEAIPSAFGNRSGEYDDRFIYLDCNNFNIESKKNNYITIYTYDDYVGRIAFRMENNRIEVVVIIGGKIISNNEEILLDNDTTTEDIINEIDETLAYLLCI